MPPKMDIDKKLVGSLNEVFIFTSNSDRYQS